VSALVVLTYIYLGGLTSAIYNEVLQFFLIVAGFIPLVWLGLKNVGGWAGLKATLGPSYVHSWVGMGNPHTNRLGVEWFGLAMGLGFVLSFGYWCNGFPCGAARHGRELHVCGAADSADCCCSENAFSLPRHSPGLIAIALSHSSACHHQWAPRYFRVRSCGTRADPRQAQRHDGPTCARQTTGIRSSTTILAVPTCCFIISQRACSGWAWTALLASFMSGMAGNVTAFKHRVDA